MIKIRNTLPDWIERFALPGTTKVDGELTNENAFWYLLTACCPLIFESYAILLHPFGINWKEKERVQSQYTTKKEIDERDFKKLSWKEFFSYYGKSFDINTAYEIQEKLREGFAKGNRWPSYLWYPSDGSAEFEDLEFIIKELIGIHGDLLVNYYYFLTQTIPYGHNDVIYQGYLSELEKLKEQVDVRTTPTTIFPDTKEWCIVSDIDLPFTYIGGTSELINCITSNPAIETFELTPKYRELIR